MQDRFQELQSIFIDGDPSPSEIEELVALLREDPQRAEALRERLMFVDLMEQALKPERSFEAFVDGLETRSRAERSADTFMEELLPKLKAVDDAQAAEEELAVPAEENVVPMPQPAWGRALVAAAAVAVAVLGVMKFMDARSEPGSLVESTPATAPAKEAKDTAMTLASTSNVVWEKKAGDQSPIEWKNGNPIPTNTPIRIKSGVALINIGPGKSLTLEGPAEMVMRSEDEGELLHGKLVAKVDNKEDPFVIHIHKGAEDVRDNTEKPADMSIQIAGGATGIRTLGNQIETSMFSPQGDVAIEFERKEKNLSPFQTAITKANKRPRIDTAPFDLSPYQAHWPLLSWVEAYSEPIQIGMPGVPNPFQGQTSDPSKIQVYLENDKVRLTRPLMVDVVPGTQVDLSDVAGSRQELQASDSIRSYIMQLDALQGRGLSKDAEYVDAFITFEQPILGLSTSEETLNQSDLVTGYDIAGYLQASGVVERGLAKGDTVKIREDGRTLDVRIKVAQRQNAAQLRVFVESPE